MKKFGKLNSLNNVDHVYYGDICVDGYIEIPEECNTGLNFNPTTGVVSAWYFTPEQLAKQASRAQAISARKAERDEALAEWTAEQIGQMTAQQVRGFINNDPDIPATLKPIFRRLAIGLWAAIKLRD